MAEQSQARDEFLRHAKKAHELSSPWRRLRKKEFESFCEEGIHRIYKDLETSELEPDAVL